VAAALEAERLDGLVDEPRPGQPRTISDQKVDEVITKTLETAPKDATHWSTRSIAAEVGLTQSAVDRIWKAFGLQAPPFYVALDISTGQVIGRLHARHRAVEFKRFVQTLDREVPRGLDVHVILDNSSRTRRRRPANGSRHTLGSCCTSRPPRVPG
jgi:hypothetical protein